MHYFLLVGLCPLLINGAAVQFERRQDPFAAGGPPPTKLKAFKIEEIAPRTKIQGARRMRLVYGPYKIQAANDTRQIGNYKSMDKGGTSYMNLVDDDFPKDIMVLNSISEVQTTAFKRATTAEGVYNHHNVFMDMATAPLKVYGCAEGVKNTSNDPPVSIIAAGATEATSNEFAAVKGNVKSGYYLTKNRNIMNMIDVVNYKNVVQEIYTSTELEYVPGRPVGYLDSNQYRVDPGICGGQSGSAIHPPHGVSKFSINSTGIVMKQNGYIINSYGHMHDGGVNIILKINDKVVCDSKALYGGPGFTTTVDGKVWETIRESTKCLDPILVKKGDRVYMQANYDTVLHPSRNQGGHGGMNMGAAKYVSSSMDGGMDGGMDAEQMALVVTHFAVIPN